MTIKLSETQIAALKTGLTNDKGFIDFGKLNGGAQTKVTTALITKKLAGFRAGNLVITTQGRQAAGEPAETAPPRESKEPRLDTKQAQLIAMMRRPEGVTIDEAVERLDWQAHTVRGAIAGALKKGSSGNRVGDWGDHSARKACG